MVLSGVKLSQILPNAPKLLQMVPNGLNILNGLKWLQMGLMIQMVPKGPKWFQIVRIGKQNSLKLS